MTWRTVGYGSALQVLAITGSWAGDKVWDGNSWFLLPTVVLGVAFYATLDRHVNGAHNNKKSLEA